CCFYCDRWICCKCEKECIYCGFKSCQFCINKCCNSLEKRSISCDRCKIRLGCNFFPKTLCHECSIQVANICCKIEPTQRWCNMCQKIVKDVIGGIVE